MDFPSSVSKLALALRTGGSNSRVNPMTSEPCCILKFNFAGLSACERQASLHIVRALPSAAPLKHRLRSQRTMLSAFSSPRSPERGPVEAMRVSSKSAQGEWIEHWVKVFIELGSLSPRPERRRRVTVLPRRRDETGRSGHARRCCGRAKKRRASLHPSALSSGRASFQV
jgi:hypothetical protein